MPIIARFVLAADAALFQTLLEEKGIPSTLLDGNSGALGLSNLATADISVPDEHAAHALAIYADYAKDNATRADATERAHPNKGFPFFAVFAFMTLAIIIFMAAMILPSIRADADADTWLFFIGSVFLSSIIMGLFATWAIAFMRMIPSVFPAIFKKKPAK